MGRSSKWKQPFLVQTVTSICLLSVCIWSGRLHKTSQSNSDAVSEDFNQNNWIWVPSNEIKYGKRLSIILHIHVDLAVSLKGGPGTRTRLQCTSPRKYAWINAACTQSPWPRHCPCRWKEGFSYQKCVVLTPFTKKGERDYLGGCELSTSCSTQGAQNHVIATRLYNTWKRQTYATKEPGAVLGR